MCEPALRESPSPLPLYPRRGALSPSINLLRRVLSSSSIAGCSDAGGSPARALKSLDNSPARRGPPPPIDTPASFGSECELDEEELLSISVPRKKQRVASRLGPATLVPLGRSSSINRPWGESGSPQFGGPSRPPPIRTITSLEGGFDCDVILAPSRLASALAIPVPSAPTAPHLLLEDEGGPNSCTRRPPSVRPSSSGGRHGAPLPFRSSRLAVPAMSLVSPGLYVGDEASAASEAWLRQQGITHVLNCTAKVSAELEAASSCIGYLRLDLLDSIADLPRMKGALRTGVDFIRDALAAGGSVLVHCHRGISRSATLAMAYLIESEQRTAESVFEQLRSHRRIVDPNLSYWCVLHDWERAVLVTPHRPCATPPAHPTPPPPLVRSRSSALLTTQSPRPLSRAG